MSNESWLRLRTSLARVRVSQIASAWRAAPLIVVVPTAADFPVPVAPGTVGLYRQRTVFVVADQPLEQAGRVLAHEAIGHHAGRATFGRGWRHFALAVHRAAKKGGDVLLRRVRLRVRSTYIDQRGRPDLRPACEGDEIVAAVAEMLYDHRTGRLLTHDPVLKMGEALVGQIARERLRMEYPVDLAQVEGALLLNEHTLRHGSLFWGTGYHVRRGYRALLTAAGLILLVVLPLLASAAPRSSAERAAFIRENPCPSTGLRRGSCPGYVVDHISPLCAGGLDARGNMQWQDRAASIRKDAEERRLCRALRR